MHDIILIDDDIVILLS